ncbi:hypothetical protein L2E82_03629 [Cichorium intybus]|uniref:Uncharacterized protein n=1 Tax=Cichorium intybus TaxID=13427 RepID=A0ACB9H526_CICIN|nr:hypothetical protein L2E82_03629 [Cichorium intybus]
MNPIDSNCDDQGNNEYREDDLNKNFEESNQRFGEDDRRSEREEDDIQVEESDYIIKNRNVSAGQNEAHINFYEEVNKKENCMGKQTDLQNDMDFDRNWPPLIDKVVPDGVDLVNDEARKNGVTDESMCLGDESADYSCSNPVENDVNSLDLNSDPIEVIEDQFLNHTNNIRKSKKAKFATASLKFKDVLRANNLKKNKKAHKSHSTDHSENISHNSVSREMELTKKVGAAVGFQLDGHDRLLRSEIEGEGVSKLQK